MLGIDVEQLHGRSSRWCQCHNFRTLEHEVLWPAVSAWVKQTDDLVHVGIEAAQVRSLLEVASVKGDGQVRFTIINDVLLRNDVLDVKRALEAVLRDAAILATVVRSLPKGRAEGIIDHEVCRCRTI